MKIRFIYLISYLLFFQIGLFAQEEMPCNSIKVKVKAVPDLIMRLYLTMSFNGNRDRFKGIPTTLNSKNSIINFEPIGIDTLFFLVGNIDDKKIICIADVNMDHDFSNDYAYSFENGVFNKFSAEHIQTVTVRKSVNNKLVTRKVAFYPWFKDINDIHSIEMCPQTVHYEGTFKLNDKKYITWARRGSYGSQEWVDYIVTDTLPLDLKAFESRLNRPAKRILLDEYLIQSGDLNAENTILTYQIARINGLDKSELQGYDEGFYAHNISDKDVVNGTEISLS